MLQTSLSPSLLTSNFSAGQLTCCCRICLLRSCSSNHVHLAHTHRASCCIRCLFQLAAQLAGQLATSSSRCFSNDRVRSLALCRQVVILLIFQSSSRVCIFCRCFSWVLLPLRLGCNLRCSLPAGLIRPFRRPGIPSFISARSRRSSSLS